MAKDSPYPGTIKPGSPVDARRCRAEVFKRLVLDRSIQHGAVRLFMLLFTYRNEKDECWPGQRELRRKLGCSNDSLKPWLDSLRLGGYLSTRLVVTRNGYLTVYTLNLRGVIPEPGTPGVPASGAGVPGFDEGVPNSRSRINSNERISNKGKDTKSSW